MFRASTKESSGSLSKLLAFSMVVDHTRELKLSDNWKSQKWVGKNKVENSKRVPWMFLNSQASMATIEKCVPPLQINLFLTKQTNRFS